MIAQAWYSGQPTTPTLFVRGGGGGRLALPAHLYYFIISYSLVIYHVQWDTLLFVFV